MWCTPGRGTSWRRVGVTRPRARSASSRPTRSCTPTSCCTPPSDATGDSSRSTRAAGSCTAARSAPPTAQSWLGSSRASGSRSSGVRPRRALLRDRGCPPRLVDRWSSRHHQVQEAIQNRVIVKQVELARAIRAGGPDSERAGDALRRLQASGQLPAGEDRYLAYTTRTAKQLRTRGELDEHWTRTAREHRLDRRGLSRLRSDGARAVPSVDPGRLAIALTEFDATFTDRDARAVALEAGCGLPIATAVGQLTRLRASGELLGLADGRLTTRAHRAQERRTLIAARQLTETPITHIPAAIIEREISRLDAEFKHAGSGLTSEQRAAIEVACADKQLVIVEGHAGTGKSTVLAAVARAHAASGQQITTTSTAALAAQRLAQDLQHAGVTTTAYSTVALHRAINRGTVTLSPANTIIHDEAALASTRELEPLLAAASAAGARLILVGDPRQSGPVGAGGLWPELHQTAADANAHRQLRRNVRTRDPADRRDQHAIRTDHALDAIHGYAARGRITIHDQQRQAEDAALDAARADRQAGRRTLVIAQTSNEHLDELNARAQAIRQQTAELGHASLALTGRPYQLHAQDDIQLRQSINHPRHGRLPNGTTATIQTINPLAKTATLTLADNHTLTLTQRQLDQASARLAYVQHPFPAQGTTTDTAHLIAAEHATHRGTYVAVWTYLGSTESRW